MSRFIFYSSILFGLVLFSNNSLANYNDALEHYEYLSIDDVDESKDKLKQNMKSLMKRCKQIYEKNTGLDLDKIKDNIKRDIWWNSKKCLKYKLVDEII